MKNNSIKRIERISILLLAGSVVAMLIGVATICVNFVSLVSALNQGLGKLEYGEYIVLIAEGLVLLIHYFFVSRFLITALRAEVPFTHEAAKEMRVIGWETIILPLVVCLIRLIIFYSIKSLGEIIEVEIFELVLGVFLIQTGYVIDYATEKTIAGHKHHVMCNIVEEKYPEIYKEIEAEVEQNIK